MDRTPLLGEYSLILFTVSTGTWFMAVTLSRVHEGRFHSGSVKMSWSAGRTMLSTGSMSNKNGSEEALLAVLQAWCIPVHFHFSLSGITVGYCIISFQWSFLSRMCGVGKQGVCSPFVTLKFQLHAVTVVSSRSWYCLFCLLTPLWYPKNHKVTFKGPKKRKGNLSFVPFFAN